MIPRSSSSMMVRHCYPSYLKIATLHLLSSTATRSCLLLHRHIQIPLIKCLLSSYSFDSLSHQNDRRDFPLYTNIPVQLCRIHEKAAAGKRIPDVRTPISYFCHCLKLMMKFKLNNKISTSCFLMMDKNS